MMLFDASALLNVIRALGSDSFRLLHGNYILSLTPYEIGNAIWKETVLLKRITIDEAIKLLDLVSSSYSILNIAFPENMFHVLKIAHSLRITYYDSSYVVASQELKSTLVTDDVKLRKSIQQNETTISDILGSKVRVISTSELIGLK
jgi:predicted nucleic acid-binding protein